MRTSPLSTLVSCKMEKKKLDFRVNILSIPQIVLLGDVFALVVAYISGSHVRWLRD